MSSSGKSTKTSRTARAASLIAGAGKHFANGEVLRYGGGPHAIDAITGGLQALVDLRTEVQSARAVLATKLMAEALQAPALARDMDDFEAFVRITFGDAPDVLADFGLAPHKKPAPPTAEQKAVAIAKRAATREARGTKGKRARLRIKGDVVGVTVTPVTATQTQATVAREPGAK